LVSVARPCTTLCTLCISRHVADLGKFKYCIGACTHLLYGAGRSESAGLSTDHFLRIWIRTRDGKIPVSNVSRMEKFKNVNVVLCKIKKKRFRSTNTIRKRTLTSGTRARRRHKRNADNDHSVRNAATD